ncbi:hypothetical protein U3516DRAFT_592625 [Neocallimastix sp. 'constans']|jgi:hypothetical protein
MYINENKVNNYSESLNKDDDMKNGDGITDNNTLLMATRISTIIVILSWYIYGKYAYFCLKGLIKYKNLNFLFPLTASLFAFANNSNDIVNYIYHQSDCYKFWLIFEISATLNWAPISWLQAYRLILISKIYLPKVPAIIITIFAIIFSCIYCTFYFLNLSLFDYTMSDDIGCSVTNPGTWTIYLMIFDIIDSVFSMTTICIIIIISLIKLKGLRTGSDRLNNLVEQGIIELIIIATSKLIIYPIIRTSSSIPGFDIFWDVLSVIVIVNAFNLVNFPYKHSNDIKGNVKKRNKYNFFNSELSYCSSDLCDSNNDGNNKEKNLTSNDSNKYKLNIIIDKDSFQNQSVSGTATLSCSKNSNKNDNNLKRHSYI